MYEERAVHSADALRSDKILGRMPPANIDAERAVLGALLIHDEHFHKISDFLAPSDFYNASHAAIYQAMLSLTQRSARIDMVTLQDELIKNDVLEKIGGIAYLVALQEEMPMTGLIEQHARLVKEKAVLRELIGSALNIMARCYDQDADEIDQVLDNAEKIIFNISNKRTQQSFVQLTIWLQRTFKHLSDIKSHGKGVTGIPTGHKKLDQLTSGLQNGDLIVLAARPSMGKTALALSIAAQAASLGKCIGFFSLEMAAEQLTIRLLSLESTIAQHNIRTALISSKDWIELTNAAARLAERKLFIDDTALLTIMDLRAKARKLKTEHQLDMIVVDYLQLIQTTKRHENRHQEVSEISRSLKALAKELNIPVVALSQLSRAVDSRLDKRPMLSDLRESGAIEQDADVIMFLYRDVVYNPETENPKSTELIIGKQRNGPTGTIMLEFIRESTRFVDAPDDGGEF